MKSFDRIMAAVLFVAAALIAGVNFSLLRLEDSDRARPYRVEIYRLAAEIERDGFEKVSLDGCEYVTGLEIIGKTGSADAGIEWNAGYFAADSDYLICAIGGTLYRFDYTADAGAGRKRNLAAVNAAMGGMALMLLAVLLFIRHWILRPFEKFSDLPRQLSRGMLALPLKENKNRFFGRFVWGMDLLRENMEEQKRRALELQRSRETMLLSLSHDIKTPLSAIKLYAKALLKGIYSEKEKQLETAENIGKKADEIGAYLSQIADTLREDIISFPVRAQEFYLAELVEEIKEYYQERLLLLGMDFQIAEYPDCLLKGDLDRSVEVLQNVLENAVKYGDGKWIFLAFSQEENCVLVTVQNSGCTLSAEELPHIFESFWRGSNAGTAAGSGLGLYICRQLMHRMNGEIFAEQRGDTLAVTAVFGKAL